MTTGIYLLTFSGTYKVYVGLSLNIEKRYVNHISNMKNNSSCLKLQEAYNIYGVPEYIIHKECSPSELNKWEVLTIAEFNSVSDGFNSMLGGDASYGENAAGAKYTNIQYIEILRYLANTSLSNKDIAEACHVPESVVRHISSLDRHYWLSEASPEDYKKLHELRRIGNKNCAKARGINYPKVRSPDGAIHEVFNLTQFSKLHGLQSGPLSAVLNGRTLSHKGWTVEGKQIPNDQKIKAPDGTIYNIPYRGIKPFSREHNLHPSDLGYVLKGIKKSCKGWTIP